MIFLYSSGSITRPVGFDGELTINSFDFGVIAVLTRSAVRWKSVDSVSTQTTLPSAKWTISGKETQQGFSSNASSPGLIKVTTALNMPPLPPTTTQHCSGV